MHYIQISVIRGNPTSQHNRDMAQRCGCLWQALARRQNVATNEFRREMATADNPYRRLCIAVGFDGGPGGAAVEPMLYLWRW